MRVGRAWSGVASFLFEAAQLRTRQNIGMILQAGLFVIVFLRMVYHTLLSFRTDGARQVLDDGDDRGGVVQVPDPRKEVEC